jgi:predicted phage tail component-like protein
MSTGFIFNGTHSSDLYIKAIRTNPVLVAEKNHTFVEIPNKSGSVMIRDATAKDITETIQVWFERPSHISARRYGRMLDNWLTTTKWEPLIFDDDDTYYREAVMVSAITLEDVRLPFGTFEISFRCRPTFLPVGGG